MLKVSKGIEGRQGGGRSSLRFSVLCLGWLRGLAWVGLGGDKKVAIPTHTKIIQVRTILVGGASAKIRVEWVSLFNWSISPSQSKVFC